MVIVIGVIGLIPVGCTSSDGGSSFATPIQTWNEIKNLLLTADGSVKVPLNAEASLTQASTASDGSSGAPAAGLDTPAVDIEELIEWLKEVPEDNNTNTEASVGRGTFRIVDIANARFSVACEDFSPQNIVFQERDDICWAASVEMVERYQLPTNRSQQDILMQVMGEQAVQAKEGTGLNTANIYEIIRAFNPDAVSEEGETQYMAIQALALTRGNTESTIYYGLKQVSRFMNQFVGTEEMLASLARGEPVVVGITRPHPDKPGQTFGHAMVLYGAEFTLIPVETSSEYRLLNTKAMVDLAISTMNLLYNKSDEEESGLTFTEAFDGLKNTGKDFVNLFGGDKQDDDEASEPVARPYSLAITSVQLADPLGKPAQVGAAPNPFAPTDTLTGEEFRDNFLYAMTYRRAQTVLPGKPSP